MLDEGDGSLFVVLVVFAKHHLLPCSWDDQPIVGVNGTEAGEETTIVRSELNTEETPWAGIACDFSTVTALQVHAFQEVRSLCTSAQSMGVPASLAPS